MKMIKNVLINIATIAVTIGFVSGAIFIPGIKFLEWVFPGDSIIIVGMAVLMIALYITINKFIEGGE